MDYQSMSDRAIQAVMGERLRRERLNRDMTQPELAERAGISRRTLQKLEAGHSSTVATLLRVLRALALMDRIDALLPDPGPSPIQLAILQGRERQRASGRRKRNRKDA